jgi:ATP-dependent Clp protease protease subunit
MTKPNLVFKKEDKIMLINPYVIDDKGRASDIFSRVLDDRVVYVSGEVTDDMAATVTAQLLHLAAKNDDDIKLYINSPGGSVSAGLAIYDTMKFIKPDVATVCMGHAASMGAVLLSGGTKGKRYILPHSEVMIHQPYGGVEGVASDILIAADHIKDTRKVLVEILAENCDKTIEELAKDTERDYWMRAEEAVRYGVVDKVL